MSTNAGLGVKSRIIFVAAAVLTVGVGAACSSGHGKPQSGTLRAGTAQLAVNGEDAGTTDAVQCSTMGSLTTIKTGDDVSGATAMVSNADKLTVQFIRVRDVGGFTGDYNSGLGGEANVAVNGSTYEIVGTAQGYSQKSVEPTTQRIRIKVAC